MDREPGHVPEMYLELEVRDKYGNIIHQHRQKARTWVKNFASILRYAFAGAFQPIQRQDGTVGSQNATVATMFAVNAPSGNTNYGILVGMGTKAWAFDDYKLDNKIAHGTSANQLQYDNATVEDLVIGSNYFYFRIVRTFTNASSSSITVTEVGLAILGNNDYPILARDLLSTPVTVPPGSTLTVRYIISMSW